MPKSKKEFTTVSPIPLEDTPAVIAYRMGELETAVREGFVNHDKKLESLTNNFASSDRVGDIEKRLDNFTWYWRALVTAALFALGSSIVTLFIKK